MQSHAVPVEEAFEVELKTDRTDVTDSECVANQRVSGAAACDPANAQRSAFLEHVPDGEEILLISNFCDDRKLLDQLHLVQAGFAPIAQAQSLMSEAVEHGWRGRAVSGNVSRESEGLEVE